MPGGSVKTREHRQREIRSTVTCRDRGVTGSTATTANVTAWVTGGTSLLRFGLYIGFMPESTPPLSADFTGLTFKIYGWIMDANGKRARASETPINGSAGTAVPDGWEGCGSHAEYEVQMSLGFTTHAGEFRLIVVAEPAMPGMTQQQFDELVERVTVRLDGDVPVVAQGP